MVCEKCGEKLKDSAKFCPFCGAKQSAPVLNDNFGSEDTVLLSEDEPALNDNFGSENTVLLSEDEPALNDNFGSENTVLLSEDEPALNDNFGSEDTVLLGEEASMLNDNFGSENTVLLHEEEPAPAAPEPVFEKTASAPNNSFTSVSSFEDDDTFSKPAANTDVFGAEAPKSSDVFGNVDPFGNEIKNEPEKKEELPPLKRRERPEQHFDDNDNTAPVPPIPPVYPNDRQPDYGRPNNRPDYDPYGAPPQYGGQPVPPPYQRQAPPPPYADIEEEEPRKKSSKKKKSGGKIGGGRVFGATLLSIFSVIFLFVLSLLSCLKFGASPKTLRKGIEDLDSNTLFSAEFDDDELSNDMYKTLGIKGATEGEANKEEFKQFLIKSDILEFIGQNVENYAKYIFEGKDSDPSLTASDITDDFFGNKDNNRIAKEEMGVKFSDESLDIIESRLDKNNVDKNLSVKHWNKQAGFDLKNVSYALSYVTLGMLLALVLVFLIWIAVVVDRRGRYVAGFFGTIFLISGLIIFLIGFGILVVSPMLYAITNNVIFYAIFHVLLKFGIITISTGFGELVIAFILKRVKRSIKHTEKTARAVAKAQRELQTEN